MSFVFIYLSRMDDSNPSFVIFGTQNAHSEHAGSSLLLAKQLSVYSISISNFRQSSGSVEKEFAIISSTLTLI